MMQESQRACCSGIKQGALATLGVFVSKIVLEQNKAFTLELDFSFLNYKNGFKEIERATITKQNKNL
jgi:hypothetical protein